MAERLFYGGWGGRRLFGGRLVEMGVVTPLSSLLSSLLCWCLLCRKLVGKSLIGEGLVSGRLFGGRLVGMGVVSLLISLLQCETITEEDIV